MEEGLSTDLVTKLPSECTAEELADFEACVLDGGEVVSAGLDQRIRAAKLLAFVREGSLTVAVGALKRPVAQHRESVFAKAVASAHPTSFPFELGWIYVAPDQRDKGVASKIVRQLLEGSDDAVYATARTTNQQMIKILITFGFQQDGEPFQGELSAEQLVLLVRSPAGPA